MKSGFSRNTSTWIYKILYPWVSRGQKWFFEKLEVEGSQVFPVNRPVLLIGNHQNAMMDPLIFCNVVPKQLHWLTRSDVFKKGLIAEFLYKLNMLPIYREKDGVADQMARNEIVFQACRDRMSKGAVLAMFPEGSHRGKKQLMTPLKKGFARLAFSSIDQDPSLINMVILPVGLEYSSFINARPKVFVKFGNPIEVESYYNIYSVDNNKGISALIRKATEELSAVMIDIRNEEVYEHAINLQPIIEMKGGGRLHEKWLSFKQFTEKLNSGDDWLISRTNSLSQLLNKHNLTAEDYCYFNEPRRELYILQTCVELIFAIPGLVAFFPLYWLTERFIQKNVQDELFYNSIRLAFYTFLSPFYILGLMLMTWGVFGFTFSITWMGLFFWLGTGLFASSFVVLKRKALGILKVGKFKKSKKNQWVEIHEKAQELQKRL
jgi:1-acyl-sn-glycerol-3-phosphate acyltransferase